MHHYLIPDTPRVMSEDCEYHTLDGLTTWEGLNIKSRLDSPWNHG
ncbi:MAG: hypothetical protein V3V00_14605 [Saprospiraceae bacterium]